MPLGTSRTSVPLSSLALKSKQVVTVPNEVLFETFISSELALTSPSTSNFTLVGDILSGVCSLPLIIPLYLSVVQSLFSTVIPPLSIFRLKPLFDVFGCSMPSGSFSASCVIQSDFRRTSYTGVPLLRATNFAGKGLKVRSGFSSTRPRIVTESLLMVISFFLASKFTNPLASNSVETFSNVGIDFESDHVAVSKISLMRGAPVRKSPVTLI